MVDLRQNFGSATVLNEETVEGARKAFVMFWCYVYPGYREILKVDQRSCFTSIT